MLLTWDSFLRLISGMEQPFYDLTFCMPFPETVHLLTERNRPFAPFLVADQNHLKYSIGEVIHLNNC